MTISPTGKDVEFWFEFGSNYSYLSVMRIGDMARQHGLRIVWRPFLLGPIFKSQGWETSPFVLQKAKGDHMWKDMMRQCEKYGLPWQRPTLFPRRALLPMRIALLAADEPWMEAFCQRVMVLNFADDRDIDSRETMQLILNELALPADELIATAQGDAVKHLLREQTAQAQARGIFGAPSFFVRGEMFWGNDRLDDAIAFALKPA